MRELAVEICSDEPRPDSLSFAHGLVSEQCVGADAAIEWKWPGDAPRRAVLDNQGKGRAPEIVPRAPPNNLFRFGGGNAGLNGANMSVIVICLARDAAQCRLQRMRGRQAVAPTLWLSSSQLSCVWLIRQRLRSHEARRRRQRSQSPPFFSRIPPTLHHRVHRNRDGEVNEVTVHVGTTSCRHSPVTKS